MHYNQIFCIYYIIFYVVLSEHFFLTEILVANEYSSSRILYSIEEGGTNILEKKQILIFVYL